MNLQHLGKHCYKNEKIVYEPDEKTDGQVEAAERAEERLEDSGVFNEAQEASDQSASRLSSSKRPRADSPSGIEVGDSFESIHQVAEMVKAYGVQHGGSNLYAFYKGPNERQAPFIRVRCTHADKSCKWAVHMRCTSTEDDTWCVVGLDAALTSQDPGFAAPDAQSRRQGLRRRTSDVCQAGKQDR